MRKQMKRKWSRPTLTILIRGEDRQGGVLNACKRETEGWLGPGEHFNGCDFNYPCPDCSVVTVS